MSREFDNNLANFIRGTFGTAIPQPFTLSAWVKKSNWPPARDAFMGLAQAFGSGETNSVQMRDGSPADNLELQIFDTSASTTKVAAAAPGDWDDTWVLIMAVCNDGANFPVTVYIGDVSQTSSANPNKDIGSVGELVFGQNVDGAQHALEALMGHMSVWDIGLSAANFTTLANGAPSITVEGASLRGYYPCDTDTGGTIPDQSGNGGPTLTVNGTVAFNADNPPVTAGSAINDVNGDDTVKRGASVNQINGSGLTGATAVTIGGVTQSDFVVSSDVLITFTTEIDSTADLQFGAQTLIVVHPGGDLNHPITLIPANGKTFVDVAGLPWPAGSKSIFDGLSPAVSDGDQCEYDNVTSLGLPVTVNPDGTFTIGGGGTEPQTFNYQVHRSLDSDQWSADFTAFVNFTPVITNVGVADFSPLTDLAIPVDGDHFGVSQLGSKVYLNMVDNKDGNEVEQNITSWSDTQIILTDWTLGALPGAQTMFVLVEVE